MKPRPFDYVRPDTVEEAVALLAEYGDDARILAGGQSLVPMLNLRLIDASVLIDISRIAALDAFAVMVSARGREVDFVSRFFAPNAGIAEDPVTGSAHCTLAPYWAAKLDKRAMSARQLSARGGELWVEMLGDRVTIAGNTVEYLRGEITI